MTRLSQERIKAMRILSLRMKHYRQYNDVTLDLPKPQKGKLDLNVLVGLNGAGKTNIANAICWCLWDIEPDLALQGKNTGKGKLNDKVRERLKAIKKTTCEIEVSLRIALNDAETESLLVVRTCECAVDTSIEHPSVVRVTHVRRGQEMEMLDGESAQLEIEAYLPSDISSYLIFDGEQLTNYFRSDRAAKVKTAMLSLSGVGRLNVALEHHEKQLQEIDRGVSDHSQEVQECERLKAQAEASCARNGEELERCAGEVEKLKESILKLREFIGSHKNVPELLKRKEACEGALLRIHGQVSQIREEKCELIRTYYPLLAVFPTAMKLRKFIAFKRDKSELPPPLKREFFEEILKLNRCSVCGEILSEKARKEVEKKLELYDRQIMATDTSNELTKLMEPQIVEIIGVAKMYLRRRDKIIRDERELSIREAEIDEELQKVNKQLSEVNDTKAYQDAIQKQTIQESQLQNIVERLGYCKARKPELEKSVFEAKANYEKAYQKNATNKDLIARHGILEMSARLIRLTKEQMVENIRISMEKKVNLYWQALTWKPKDEIGVVSIDEDFKIGLEHNGLPALGTLSAAERALLALSVTLALHSQAGLNFPFVIDTPVANMSLEHRRNFAKVLRTLSMGKQITMLFTDTEYVADIPAVFGKGVNIERQLVFRGGVTTIEEV